MEAALRKRYAVVVERASERNWSAYVPDLPGCVSTGATAEETPANIERALAFHLCGQAEDGITGASLPPWWAALESRWVHRWPPA